LFFQITKIIRGAFDPLPPSRSPELRGLISALLVLDARKRPSINEVLGMPVLRARIARFLDQTLQVRQQMNE
jgi:NIMA (never in mitosis gene a)-related kinase